MARKSYLSSIFKGFLAVCFSFSLFSLFSVRSLAKTSSYDRYDVTIEIDKDSTFLVTEEITWRFDGEFSYITRNIPLRDPEKEEICAKDPTKQCGGLSQINWIGIYDSLGREVSKDEYSVSVAGDDLAIKWVFEEDGRTFNDETFSYQLKYKVFGGLGYFDDYDMFYWNMVPPKRGANVKDSHMVVRFPEEGVIKSDSVRIYSGYLSATYTLDSSHYAIEDNESSLVMDEKDLINGKDYTVSIKFRKGVVVEPSSIKINSNVKEINVILDGMLIQNVTDELKGVVPGHHTIELKALWYGYDFMYDKYTTEIDLLEGEKKVIDVNFELNELGKLLTLLTIVITILGYLTLPLGLFGIYILWKKKGKDETDKKFNTIIPFYTPPNDMSPYLLGSLKDENVDNEDISGTIIDLAYRGYIHIKEVDAGGFLRKKKEYIFTKEKNNDENLTSMERRILNAFFNSKKNVNISKDLDSSFAISLDAIKDDIYEEMVDNGFFDKNPKKEKLKYTGAATMIITVSGSILPFVMNSMLYFFIPFTVSLLILGIVFLFVGNKMGKKTLLGSEMLHKIKGFKMYMQTAERFRVQNLTPETFEKYLSYAVVFKIEKQWAEKFKDIYKEKPSWYESDSDVFTSYMLTDALSDINKNAHASIAKSFASSESSSFGGGSSWSGGGGFSGGFSGGGGGGGGSGAG